ncbi:hypothetical protein J3459_012789 [Metarhizium acridum]|nr:hypothetical protein J3459_012789 [Metarhizium acridum]
MELGPYRIFCINGWKTCDAEKDLSAMTVDNISLALAASEGDPKWYGTLNDYYAAVKSTVGAMFEPDLSHSLTLTLCVGDTTGDYCEIQFIDRDYNQSRFSNCTFDVGGRSLGHCEVENKIAQTIKENASHKRFMYTAKSQWLDGMKLTEANLY